MLRDKVRCLMLGLAIFNLTYVPGDALASPPSEASSAAGKQPGGDKRCQPYGNLTLCACEKDMAKIQITSPQGMKLVSVEECKMVKEWHEYYGNFIFEGEATVSGVVRREDNFILGDLVTFNAKKPGAYSQFSSRIYSLRFGNAAIGKFKLPALSGKSRCWNADAVIKVKKLKVVVDESDGAGNFPTDFEVLKVGKYRRCAAD